MPNLVPWLLLLHVMGAIVAFGPTYIHSIIGGLGATEPQHANFGLRVSETITKRLVIPLAMLQGVTGLLLIISRPWNLTDPNGRWLVSGIILYVVALGYATGVQAKKVRALIELTGKPRPADAPPGPVAGAMELIKSIQFGGKLLSVLIFVIVLVMVVKPTM